MEGFHNQLSDAALIHFNPKVMMNLMSVLSIL